MQVLIAVLILLALFGAWVVYERVSGRADPDGPVEPPRCDGCDGENSCGIPGFACAVEAREREEAARERDAVDAGN